MFSTFLITVLPFAVTAFVCTKDGFFRHPHKCSKFYRCVAGTAYEFTCSEGLLFNEILSQCDWPANVNCIDTEIDDGDEGRKTTSRPRPQPPPVADTGEMKVVCYFINWAWYRNGKGKFLPENVDPTLCTHINYAFAVLDPQNYVLKPHDTWADIDNSFYERVVDLKKQNSKLTVSLAIGGWIDSGGPKYSQLVADAGRRRRFINEVIPFLKNYGFDGLDLDWEYPNCWQGACGSAPADVANFATWVKELREAFDKQSPRLLLTAAVSAGKDKIDQAYDVQSIERNLDFLNVMTYDFHGGYDGRTGHHSQMFPRPDDANPNYNVKSAMEHWVNKGATKKKLILGVPFYARSFTLSDPSQNGLNAPAIGNGREGDFIYETGFMAFYEVCERVKNRGWTKKTDDKAGPYAYRGDQWVGYDDVISIYNKAKYAKDNGYGGIMIWDVSMDDFTGSCCSVKNPLLRAINIGLTGQGNPYTIRCE